MNEPEFIDVMERIIKFQDIDAAKAIRSIHPGYDMGLCFVSPWSKSYVVGLGNLPLLQWMTDQGIQMDVDAVVTSIMHTTPEVAAWVVNNGAGKKYDKDSYVKSEAIRAYGIHGDWQIKFIQSLGIQLDASDVVNAVYCRNPYAAWGVMQCLSTEQLDDIKTWHSMLDMYTSDGCLERLPIENLEIAKEAINGTIGAAIAHGADIHFGKDQVFRAVCQWINKCWGQFDKAPNTYGYVLNALLANGADMSVSQGYFRRLGERHPHLVLLGLYTQYRQTVAKAHRINRANREE